MTNPYLISIPFSDSGDKQDILDSAPIDPNDPTWVAGFPAVTSTPISEGGLPPKRISFNGVLNAITQNIVHQSKGLMYEFDADYAAKIGGYPLNSRLALSNGDVVKSTIPNNSNDPNMNMTGWVNPSLEQNNIYNKFKDKLYVTPFDFGYKNQPDYDFNAYLQLAIDSGHRVIKGAESNISVNIKSPVFVRTSDLDIDLSMITATIDTITVANVWTTYSVPTSAGNTAVGIINIHGTPINDYRTATSLPAVKSRSINLAAHGFTVGQKIGLEVEYKLGLTLKNRLLVTVQKVIDIDNFVIDYEFFYAPLSLRIHTFSNVVDRIKLKAYRKVTDTNTATSVSSAFACVSIAWSENCETMGSEFVNGALSSLQYYMTNNCMDSRAVTKHPRSTTAGTGYTIQNMFSLNNISHHPRNYGGRHVYDFSGSAFCEVINPKSYYLVASTPVLLTHGIFEHDLTIDSCIDVGSIVSEIGIGHAGEEYGRTSQNINIKNSKVTTIRLDSMGCKTAKVSRCDVANIVASTDTEIKNCKVSAIINIQALNGYVNIKNTEAFQVYINPQYLNASGTAVYQDSTADITMSNDCKLNYINQSTYKVNSINFKDSTQRYTVETASHYELIATSAITYKNCDLSSVNTKATGNALNAPYIYFDDDCELKDISYVIKTPSYGNFIFSGKYKEPSIDKTNPLIDLTNSSIYAQFFFKNAKLLHKYAASTGNADLAIKASTGGRCVLEISNSFVRNNIDFTANLGAVYTLMCVNNIWQSSNFVAGTSTANKVFANNAVFAV